MNKKRRKTMILSSKSQPAGSVSAPNKKLLALIESDDPGCGKEFDPNLCFTRHRIAKVKEARGKEYGPCAYCLKFVTQKTDNVVEEIQSTELAKTESIVPIESPIESPIKPTQEKEKMSVLVKECKHCHEVKRIAGRGICSKCYSQPGVKETYPVWQIAKGAEALPLELPVDGTKSEPSQSITESESMPVTSRIRSFIDKKREEIEGLEYQIKAQRTLIDRRSVEVCVLIETMAQLELALKDGA